MVTASLEGVKKEPIDPVLIIGAGLIGASIGQCLTEAGLKVFLTDADYAHAVVAASRGAGAVEAPDPATIRLVIVATPPSVTPAVVVEALEQYPTATVTDVASVKASIESAVLAKLAELDRLDDARRYVSTHPMAGSHRTGPLTAAADLFTDRTWVIISRRDQEPKAIATCSCLIEACGAKQINLDANSHDQAVATVSHLPQLMSSLMAAQLTSAPAGDLALAGQGVRDVTRIARSDASMWGQIVTANAIALKQQLLAVQSDLADLVGRLDDPLAVANWLEKGKAGVAALPGKHGRAPVDLVAVVIQIPDTPGALAKLFTDIDAQGVNVEDLSIEHDPVREAGYLAVQVACERAESLATVLQEKGWQVS